MSIATQITRLNNNIEAMKNTKQQIKDAVNNDFDIIANEQIENYDTLIENGLELYKQYIPPVETNQAIDIQVTDAMKCNSNKLELFGNTYQLSLPSGYTRLEYIECTGTQYINLDYAIKSNTKLEIEYQTEKVGGNTLFGASNNNMNYYASGLAGGTAQTGQDTPTTIKVSTNLSTEKTSLLWERAQVTYNGNIVTGNFGLDDSRLVLFKNRRWPNDLGKVKLYKFIAYDENVIAANYIPCKNSNNEIGLYDLVSNTFYGNSGTGDFAAGTDLGTMPSPDYPQDIHVVTGNNSVGVQGKNLFDKANANIKGLNAGFTNEGTFTAANNQKHVYIKCKPNTYYVISKDFSKGWVQGIYVSQVAPAVGVSAKRLYWGDFDPPVRVKTSDNANYLDVRLNTGAETTATINKILDGLQIEEGSTATDYAPYYHADYPINLGSLELCKIGDYQDYLYKENGNWYEYEAIDKIVLDGTYQNTTINTASTNTSRMYFTNIQTTAAISINEKSQKSNMFIPASINGIDVEGGYAGSNKTTVVRLNKTRAGTTKESFNSYLSEHNIVIYYPLLYPASTQITDETLTSQLDEIYEHLKLVKGTNNITVTASDLKPYMKLSYKNYELTSNE